MGWQLAMHSITAPSSSAGCLGAPRGLSIACRTSQQPFNCYATYFSFLLSVWRPVCTFCRHQRCIEYKIIDCKPIGRHGVLPAAAASPPGTQRLRHQVRARSLIRGCKAQAHGSFPPRALCTAATCRRGGGGGRVVCSAVPPEPESAGGDSRGDLKQGLQRSGKDLQEPAEPVADWPWRRNVPPPRRSSPAPQQQQGVWTSQPRGPPPGAVDSFYPRRQVAQLPGSEASTDGGYGAEPRTSTLGSQASFDTSFDFPNLGSDFDAVANDEDGVQQQRQWRQRALRSLRQDLRAGGGGGASSSGARNSARSGSEPDFGPRSSRGGAGARGDSRAPPRPLPSSGGRGSGAGGTAPPGCFLQTLQGEAAWLAVPYQTSEPRPHALSTAEQSSADALARRACACPASTPDGHPPAARLACHHVQIRPPCAAPPWPLTSFWFIAPPPPPRGPLARRTDAGLVDEGGQPTELGQRQGVGFSSYMNVCINKLLAYSTE